MLAVLCAMAEEAAALIAALDQRQDHVWVGGVVHSGSLDGQTVAVARSGIGKVLAATCAQHLITEFRPSALICTGLAGAIAEDLAIGDCLVATDCVQYDLDVRALGFALGQVPFSDWRFFQADPELLRRLDGFRPPGGGRCRRGRIASGDRFVTAVDPGRAQIHEELGADAVEMEGAALAQVAALHGLPWLVVRTISDRANGSAPHDFMAFLPQAAANSLAVLRMMLRGTT